MYQPQAVHRLETTEEVPAGPYYIVRLERTRCKAILERGPIDQLHDVELEALTLASPLNDDHVLVADAGEHLRLAQERLGAGGGRELGPEDFDGDGPVEHHLVSEIDAPHATTSELSLYAVVRRHCALQSHP